MKRIGLFVAAVAVAVGIGGAAPMLAGAETPKSTVCSTLQAGANCTGSSSNSTSINNVIGAIVNLLSFLVGVAAVIMIIFGGFRYVTSGGDSGKITSAKNTIIYAIIGLVVVALAQIIVRFVIQKVT